MRINDSGTINIYSYVPVRLDLLLRAEEVAPTIATKQLDLSRSIMAHGDARSSSADRGRILEQWAF